MNEALKQKRFLRDHDGEGSGSFSMNDKCRLNDPPSNVCILVPRFSNACFLFLHSYTSFTLYCHKKLHITGFYQSDLYCCTLFDNALCYRAQIHISHLLGFLLSYGSYLI